MSFSLFIVQRCYDLEASSRYKKIKHFFWDLLENPRSRKHSWFDISMILLVLSSVYLLIYEVGNDLGAFGFYFELFAVTVFIIEYLLRLWLYSDSHRIIIDHYEKSQFVDRPFRLGPPLREILAKKWDYITTPMAIIDLLAIIPSYRPLRFLRIFLLFRLFKLFRYARSTTEFVKVLSEKRFEFYTLGIFLAFVVFTAAAAIYFFESRSQGGEIGNIFDGIYWALITISTVGYGDIIPHTPEGRVITLVLIISGMGVMAFTTSIVVSAFGEKMSEMRQNQVFSELERMKARHTILCGFGRMGQMVAERLARDKMPFVVIDPDPDNMEQAKHLGYLVIQGYGERTELLKSVGVERRAERILCLTGDDVVNVYITLTARSLNPGIEIISRANRQETVRKLIQVGANHTIKPYKTVALIASEFLGKPVAFEAINGVLSGKQGIGLETVSIRENMLYDGARIGDIDFWGSRLLLFGVLTKQPRPEDEMCRDPFSMRERSFYFNPQPSFRLQAGDVLLVFGHEYSIVHFKDRLESNNLRRRH